MLTADTYVFIALYIPGALILASHTYGDISWISLYMCISIKHLYVYLCTQYNCCCCIMYGYFFMSCTHHIVIRLIVQFYYQHFEVARTEGLQQHARFSLHIIHGIQLWIFPQSSCHTALQFPPVMHLFLLYFMDCSHPCGFSGSGYTIILLSDAFVIF